MASKSNMMNRLFVTILSIISIGISINAAPHKERVALDENSTVLVTGCHDFIGMNLVKSLHHLYNVKSVICIGDIDSVDFDLKPKEEGKDDNNNKEANSNDIDDTVFQHTMSNKDYEFELATFELKRQRLFHLAHVLKDKFHLMKTSFNMAIPEFFQDSLAPPTLAYVFEMFPDITHIVHLDDFQSEANVRNDRILSHKLDDFRMGRMNSLMEYIAIIAEEKGLENIPQFVYASSHDVYRPTTISKYQKAEPHVETEGIDAPFTTHGASKLLDEILAHSYFQAHGIFSIGLRFSSVYGPWDSPGSPIYDMAQRTVSSDKNVAIIDDDADWPLLKNERDFVYIDDAVNAIMAAMQLSPEMDNPPPTVINIGSGETLSLSNVALIMEGYFQRSDDENTVMKSLVKLKDAHKEDHAPLTTLPISISRAQALLGYKPQYNAHQGVRKLLAWHYDRTFPLGDDKDVTDKTKSILEKAIESCNPFDIDCLKGMTVFPCVSECAHKKQCTKSLYDDIVLVSRLITKSCTEVMYTVDFDLDLKNIASAVAKSSSDTIPYVQGGGGNCNIAFVAENSDLVQSLKNKKGIPSDVNSADILMKFLNENDVVGLEANLLTHGFWTILPLSVPSIDDEDYYRLLSLPKYNPSFFFSAVTEFAIYCDSNVSFTSVPALLRAMQTQPNKPGIEATTAMMVAQGTLDSEKTRDQIQENVSQGTMYGAIRISLQSQFTGKESTPMIDTSWIVHSIPSPDAHSLRCHIYDEIMKWNDTSNSSFKFVLDLQNFWNIVLASYSNENAWWMRMDQTEIAVPIQNGRFSSHSVVNEASRSMSAGRWFKVLSTTDSMCFIRTIPSDIFGIHHTVNKEKR